MKIGNKHVLLGAILVVGLLFSEFHYINHIALCEVASNQSLLSDETDWQPQDYYNSLGIKAVSFREGKLVLSAHLEGKHYNYSQGEVYLDLCYFPSLGGKVPIDLSQNNITVEVEVSKDFIGQANSPNGILVFVKDVKGGSQYGSWNNIQTEGTHNATLSPTNSYILGGYTTQGFDPKKIRIIGVKLAIGTNSLDKFDDLLNITKVSINPPLEPTPDINLPPSTPNNQKNLTVGGNWRILEYGQSFGTTAWFPTGNGISKHENFIRINLDHFRRAGIKLIRTELLTDGRAMFDKDGHVIGYDETFRKDVRTLLDLASNAGFNVEFTILDYPIAGKAQEVDGVWVRGRSKILTDDSLKTEFMNGFLVPFLKEFGNHAALTGFDVINEPEWIIGNKDGGDWENANKTTRPDEPVPIKNVNSFVSDCIDRIRENAPGKLITVSASIKLNSLINNFSSLNIDYLAVHHYSTMEPFKNYLPINSTAKPWSLEEFPTKDTTLSISQYLDQTLIGGGTTALLWNLSPGIDNRTFPWNERNNILKELRSWVETPQQPTPSPSGTLTPTLTPTQSILPSPTQSPSNSPTLAPTPSIPEFLPWIILLVLIISAFSTVILRKKRIPIGFWR
jgi:hypothetical protein